MNLLVVSSQVILFSSPLPLLRDIRLLQLFRVPFPRVQSRLCDARNRQSPTSQCFVRKVIRLVKQPASLTNSLAMVF